MEFINRAREELELTPEQMVQIEVLVTEGQERTRALWEEFSPQIRAELKSIQEEIRALLTPEQRVQFEALIKKRRPPRRGDREWRGPESDTTRSNALSVPD
jgi:Spy/CpxP family protein refolding chaperone